MVWTNRMVGGCVSQSQEGEGGRHWFQGRVSLGIPVKAHLFFSVKEQLRLPAENRLGFRRPEKV